MIYQTNLKLKPQIQKYGCYLMSLIYLAVKKGKTEDPTPERVNFFYETFLKFKWINENCLVLYPAKILGFFGIMTKQAMDSDDGIRMEPTYMPFENQLEILCYKMPSYSHFVVGDGKGRIEWDPYGGSPAVTKGVLDSKRIFSILYHSKRPQTDTGV